MVAGGGAVAVVAVAAALTSPAAVLERAGWLVADPVRFLVAAVLLALVRPVLAWPVTLLAVVVGYGFGLRAVPLSLALMVTTSMPPYLFARGGRDGRAEDGSELGDGAGTSAAVGRAVDRVVGASERAVSVAGGTRSVAASRLLPLPSDAVSVGAGLAGVRTVPFVVGSAVGELPWAVGGTVAGASAGRIADAGLEGVFDPWLIAAAGLAGLLLLVGPAYRHYTSEAV